MSVLLRIPRKRKEKPLSFLQVELVSNKCAKKQSSSNEETVTNSSISQKGKKRLFTHVLTLEGSETANTEGNEKSWSTNKRHSSFGNNSEQKNTLETNVTSEWKFLDLVDVSEGYASPFTLNGDTLVKEYIGELTTEPFNSFQKEKGDFVYDLYELSCPTMMPVHDIGLPIRVLTNALDEDWLVAEDEEVLEDGFSSDTNRTYDYPETPASLTEDDGFYSENWYDIDEDSDEFDDEEGKVPALWRTEELLRKLQRTTIYESSSSSYNSERSSSDLNF